MPDDGDDRINENDLTALERQLAAASPAPWVASVQGRDHTSGDDVILVGDPREEDMYVSRDSGPASPADLDTEPLGVELANHGTLALDAVGGDTTISGGDNEVGDVSVTGAARGREDHDGEQGGCDP
ncbi:MAG TPA: hypothetical protein VID68_08580 [Solirubrobacteraceae bacterium]